MEAKYTAWHVFLAHMMDLVFDKEHIEVHYFQKLGTLPLEADIILLRKRADLDLAALYPHFDFLVPHLAPFTVIEYKSPADRLTRADFDTVRAYAMLCKRKYDLSRDADVRVIMLYSGVEGGFFQGCRENGYPFEECEPGVRRCDRHPLRYLAMDLARFWEVRPSSLINLFSSRHGRFIMGEDLDDITVGQIRYLFERIDREVFAMLKVTNLRGWSELAQDMEVLRKRLLEGYSVEERLEGIPLEERLKDLSREQLAQLKRLLDLEDLEE